MIEIRDFGSLNGVSVKEVTLNGARLRASILSYGATLRRLLTPDAAGNWIDVCLGHDDLAGYVNGAGYFGATVGRCANRIGGAAFELNGKTYRLTANDGKNQLHGGVCGLDKKIWSVTTEGESAVFSVELSDGEEGYPAAMTVAVRFSIVDGCALRIDYTAQSDGDTLCSLTNHAYFNLNGAGSGDVLGHTLQIDAAAFTPADAALIPTGEIRGVAGTCMDFRAAKPIGRDIRDEMLAGCGGYDTNFCLDGSGLRRVAAVCGEKSGICMTVETTMEGMQFYTANGTEDGVYKDGKRYGRYGALCLETQRYPDAIHHPAFPSAVLRAGERYRETTVYRFEA